MFTICRSILMPVLLWQSVTLVLSREYGEQCSGLEFTNDGSKLTYQKYLELRNKIVDCEKKISFGFNEFMSSNEKKANATIMAAKLREYEKGMKDPAQFVPAHNIMESLDQLKNNELFQLIAKMPKGALLHAYEGTIGTRDFFLGLTYDANVWVCWQPDQWYFFEMLYSFAEPEDSEICKWTLMSQLRQTYGNETVDAIFRKHLSLETVPVGGTHVTAREKIFASTYMMRQLILYEPNWSKYIYHMLDEVYKDGVQYLEVRSAFLELYTLNGTVLPRENIFKIYNDTITQFKKDHKDFFDAKVIVAPLRFQVASELTKSINEYRDIKAKYPHLIAGFDLIGPEFLNNTLEHWLKLLLTLPKDVPFYLQAGQANWQGTDIDENLFDAVLLKSRRIGGAYALLKHPLVMQMVRKRNIGIEVSPVADQCNRLVRDLRNHPLAVLLANNYPVVVSSEIPLYTGVSVLSHDLYATFLGIASSRADLRVLKRLVKNSIRYSSLNQYEKRRLAVLWKRKWTQYLVDVVKFTKNQSYNGLNH